MPQHLINGSSEWCVPGTTAKLGKCGGVPGPGVPFSVKNKVGAHFLLGLAAASEVEGGDISQTYCVPPGFLLLPCIFAATLQVNKGVADGPFYGEGN